jgi:hypothetical protein
VTPLDRMVAALEAEAPDHFWDAYNDRPHPPEVTREVAARLLAAIQD